MQNSKRIISLVLIGLFLLPLFAGTAYANGATVVSSTTYTYFQNSDGVPFSIPFYRLSTGETAYGINVAASDKAAMKKNMPPPSQYGR